MIPETLLDAFDAWQDKERYCVIDGMPRDTVIHLMRLSFAGGYVAGFGHAKNEAVRAMADALQKSPPCVSESTTT